jgi:hypothetical protein
MSDAEASGSGLNTWMATNGGPVLSTLVRLVMVCCVAGGCTGGANPHGSDVSVAAAERWECVGSPCGCLFRSPTCVDLCESHVDVRVGRRDGPRATSAALVA